MEIKESDRPESYEDWRGPDRRSYQTFEVTPSKGWLSQVTVPVLLGLIIQAGGIIWWARGVQEEQNHIRSDFEKTTIANNKRYDLLFAEIKETRNLLYDRIVK